MNTAHWTYIHLFMVYCVGLAVSSGFAASDAQKMGFNHLGAEFGAYEVDAQGSITLGGLQKGGNRLGYPLAGTWKLALDKTKVGVAEKWFEKMPGNATITFPGTLDEAGIGEPEKPSVSVLTRTHAYIGMAWYQREVDIPESWKNKTVQMWLDRVMWESRLYVDGKLIGSEDSLCTPHVYELGVLSPGKHTLTLRIDNSGRPGANCHGYGDDIQIKWNGVVGRMELIARDAVYVSAIRTIPELSKKRVRVLARIANTTGRTIDGELTLSARVFKDKEIVGKARNWFKVAGREAWVELALALDKNWKVWDEFSPSLYELESTVIAECEGEKFEDRSTTRFGVREMGQAGTQFTMNGRTLFLRGTHDGMGFMLTGHPAGDVESWRRVFSICKTYGLNHVRYHSVCPNGPAFLAADEAGIILQPELPVWATIKEDWAGQAFLQRELERILEFYGNSPSFCMFSMGNEHAGDWDFLGRLVERAKRLDPTRKYVAASNEYIRPGDRRAPVNPNDDYATIMFGAEKNGERPRIRYMERMSPGNEDFDRAADYRTIVEDFNVPVIAHELGQWWSYPDFKEIEKYTGVLKARNLELFRDEVKAAGLLEQNEELRMASGLEAVELYKEDIERNMRTPGLAGYQLLDLRDYSGQGTALVGLLDTFWDSKGFVTPEAFRQFSSPTVLLARIPKTIWEEGEKIKVPLEVAHYGPVDMAETTVAWSFTTDQGIVLAHGRTQPAVFKTGRTTVIGEAVLTVPRNLATELTLAVHAAPAVTNHWRLWCYPKKPVAVTGCEDVRVVTACDEAVMSFVEKGGKALLIATNLAYQVPTYFVNPIWTPQNNIETCGMLIRNQHPALMDFPTRGFSDFQWHNLMRPGRAFILNDVRLIQPIIQNIEAPSVRRNFHLASLFAVRLGKGALVATSFDLCDARPEFRQLKQSVLNYLAKGKFSDAAAVTRTDLMRVIEHPRFKIVSEPMGKNVLEVNAAGLAREEGFKAWKPEVDQVVQKQAGFGYRFEKTDRRWGISAPGDMVAHRGDKLHAWSLNRTTLFITCPKGFSGTVYLCFHDPEKRGNRNGYVFGLGGAVMTGTQTGEARWAMLKIRPEDSASGEIPLYFRKLAYGEGWSATPLVTKLVVTE